MNTDEIDLDKRVQQALSQGRPAMVKDVLVRHGTDSTGDPAVWLWLIVGDDVTDPGSDELDAARTWAEQTAQGAAADRWIYVAFRTQSEQRELEAQS